MYTDNAEATYMLGRMHSSIEMAGKAFDSRAALAHGQLACFYMARFAQLQRTAVAPRRIDDDRPVRATARPPQFDLGGPVLTLVVG